MPRTLRRNESGELDRRTPERKHSSFKLVSLMRDPAMSSPRLRELILARAFKFGTFTLASRKTSSFYINSKKILFHSEAIGLLADAFWEKMHDLDISAVGGLEVGAIPLTSAIVYCAHL